MHPRAAAILAGLVLLSGCTGGFGALGGDGAVDVYLSDETGSIDDFEHLNVTITQVGFKRSCDGCDRRNRTRDGGGHGGDGHDGRHGNVTGGNALRLGESGATPLGSARAMHPMDGDGDGSTVDAGDDRWVVVDVDSRTVDLTELRGKNATRLRTTDVPAGTYETVFIYVSDVNATLKSGERVDVNLPSNHLKIEKRFAVEQGESVSFVFDVTVFQRDGGYVLEPVVTDSGTNVSFCHRHTRDDQPKNRTDGCDCNCSGHYHGG